MRLLLHILTFAVFTSAVPSAEKHDSSGPQQIGKDGALTTAGQCNIGQRYCFGAIVGDLNVAKQDILHQYCNQKYKNDWQSSAVGYARLLGRAGSVGERIRVHGAEDV
ncbi:hypothetical protein N0V95_000666 [Ascochyta clinopodiicola]|nr:hypothetical protein N0V95_000666 [Ascochyta clinopodiicola]